MIEVVDQAPAGWHVRFDESGVMTILKDTDILDPALYESAEPRE